MQIQSVFSLALLVASTQASGSLFQFKDVTSSHLPEGLTGRCMDAAAHDFNGDGHLDIMLAMEFAENILLLNDGKAKFRYGVGLPKTRHDSEDIAVADFNLDGKPDIAIVSEDDKVNELYFNRGNGHFDNASKKLPLTGTSNAVVTADINGDGAADLLIGNVGPLGVLINDGKGGFIDETRQRVGMSHYRVQDLALVDVDNDGDLDLLTGDEIRNRIFINQGKGIFKDESKTRLPDIEDMTREVVSADVDGDGDMDIYYANVSNKPEKAANRLLLNNGKGYFTEATQSHLLDNRQESNFTALFVDLDGDKAIDLLVPSYNVDGSNNGVYHPYLNDGKGRFSLKRFDTPFPKGNGFDIAHGDFNGDGKKDFYLCNRARGWGGINGGADALMLRIE